MDEVFQIIDFRHPLKDPMPVKSFQHPMIYGEAINSMEPVTTCKMK